jgi:hypothetical protein
VLVTDDRHGTSFLVLLTAISRRSSGGEATYVPFVPENR